MVNDTHTRRRRLGGPHWNIAIRVFCIKTRIVEMDLPDGVKSLRICLFISTLYRHCIRHYGHVYAQCHAAQNVCDYWTDIFVC